MNNPVPEQPASASPTDSAGNPSLPVAAESMVTIPVIEEQVRVYKETDETGRIRISKQVFEDVQQVDTLLSHEEIDVQRIPFNEVLQQAPTARYEGDTYIIPVVREEVVTTIRYVLVEEIRVTKRQFQTVDSQTVTLRREAVTVEQLPPIDSL